MSDARPGVEFPFHATIPALHVEELADTLPSSICYHHEGEGQYFWSLAYMFDSMLKAMESGDGQYLPELNKFSWAVHQRLAREDATDLLGARCIHMRPTDSRFGECEIRHFASTRSPQF